MADVRLGKYEAREGRLPPVCLRCGAPASMSRRMVFYCRPWWAFVFVPWWVYSVILLAVPCLLLLLLVGRRARAVCPLCELHKHHWLWRNLVFAGAGLLPVAFFVLFLIVDPLSSLWPRSMRTGLSLLFTAIAYGGPPVFLACFLLLRYTAIYATEITSNSITLTGVAVEFVEAVRVLRRGAAPDDVEDVIPHPTESPL